MLPRIRMVTHYYWTAKSRFALEQDRYAHWTLFAPAAGKFRYRIGDKSGSAEFGQVVVCPPDTDFARSVIDPLTFHFFQFDSAEEPAALQRAGQHLAGAHETGDLGRLRSTYRYINQPGIEPAALEHFLVDLLLPVFVKPAPLPPGSAQHADPLMAEARLRLEAHAFEPYSLGALAAELGLTPVQLTRRFRSSFDTAPLDYLTDLRLEKACLLLSSTTDTLEQIALQCGYESGFYVNRLFRKRKGITPGEYRRRFQL